MNSLIETFDCIVSITSYYSRRIFNYVSTSVINSVQSFLLLAKTYETEYLNLNQKEKVDMYTIFHSYYQALNFMIWFCVMYSITYIKSAYERYLGNNHQKFVQDKLEITYKINSTKYKILLPIKSYIPQLLKAVSKIDDKIVDVTKILKCYIGPLENWHSQHITPKMLGYDNLTLFKFDNDTFEEIIKEYTADDKLDPLVELK